MEEEAIERRDQNPTDDHTKESSYEIRVGQPSASSSLIHSSKLSKAQLATLVLLSLSNFCCGSLISLYGPFFPEEAENKGMSPTLYGLAFGAYWLTIAFCIPLFAKLVCEVPTKLIHWIGVLTIGACGVLFGVLDMCPSGTAFISLVFAIRIFEGFGAASIKTSMHCLLASEFKENLRSIFSSVETFLTLGLVLGPIIGGALLYAEEFSFPFYVVGTISVISSVCSAFLLPQPEECQKNDMKRLRQFLKDPGVYAYILMTFTTLAYTGLLLVALEPHLRQFKISSMYVGMIFAIPCFTYSFSSPAWEWLIKRGMNNLLLTIFASLFTVGSLLLIGPAPILHKKLSLQFIIASLFLKGIGSAGKLASGHYGFLREVTHRGFPDDETTHGTITGIYAVSIAAGACVGTSAGGYVYETIGFADGAIVLIALEVLTMVIVFISAFLRKYQRPKHDIRREREPILPNPSTEVIADASGSNTENLKIKTKTVNV